ncbi:MAG TPA: VanZ family protein [Thermoanaerobaculia bacterium]|jgi:glycopeptide antibiotics resistance protein|nr:VanZ family protein [Thermoanaerobaculia bacterium]
MTAGRPSEAWSWVLCAVYSLALWAFVPFGRGVILALTQRHLTGVVVTLIYLVTILLAGLYVVFNVRLSDVVAFLALAVVAAATGAMALGLSIAEERVHFVEYGLLALLFRRALSFRRGPAAQYVLAWILASAVGWGDEAIQLVVPNRYYDLRDVAMNAVGAFLALVADEVVHNRLRWRGRA